MPPMKLTGAKTATEIERTLDAFAASAVLAREAGYDGVEVMGSEGYFINQFLVAHTNRWLTDVEIHPGARPPGP